MLFASTFDGEKKKEKKNEEKLSHHRHRLVIFTNTFDIDSNSIIDARKIA